MKIRLIFLILIAFCVLSPISSAQAQDRPMTPPTRHDYNILALSPSVPDALKPWIGWVKDKNPNFACIKYRMLYDQAFPCSWMGRLELTLNDDGASFTLTGSAEQKAIVVLPGGIIDHFNQTWPQNVKVKQNDTESALIVTRLGKTPVAEIEKGDFTITGNFSWQDMPEKLLTPASLIKIKNKDKVIYPTLLNADTIDLKTALSGTVKVQAVTDSLGYEIYRLYSDGAPFKVTTMVKLFVSGKQREYLLSDLIPSDLTITEINSPLPYSLLQNNGILLQLTAGTYAVTISALSQTPPDEIASNIPSTDESPAQEIIAWQPDPMFRNVELSGAPSVSFDLTQAPSDWRPYALYVLSPENKITLAVSGEKYQGQNQLALARSVWLDFDGKGMSVEDNLAGKFVNDWQLVFPVELEAGSASINGQDRLLTVDPVTQLSNLEIRNSSADIKLSSRMKRSGIKVLANGFENIKSLKINFNLPPGWSVFAVTGVDDSTNNWLSNWTLFDIFLTILIVAAVYKLFGAKIAALAFLGIGLSFHQSMAPVTWWLYLLIVYALLKYMPTQYVKTLNFFKRAYVFLIVVISLQILAFASIQIRNGLFPNAASRDYYPQYARYQSNQPVVLHDALPTSGASVAAVRAKGYDSMELVEESYSMSKAPVIRKQKLETVDPNAIIQTGTGSPIWSWSSASFSWNGPVPKNQTIGLYLINPTMNLILSFLRIILLCLLLTPFMKKLKEFFTCTANVKTNGCGCASKAKSVPASFAGIFLTYAVLAGFATQASAQFPDEKLLQELEIKLINSVPSASWNTSKAHITVATNKNDSPLIRIEAEVHALTDIVWRMPGKTGSFSHRNVLVDGKETPFVAASDNFLAIKLSKGIHSVTTIGSPVKDDFIEVEFPDIPNKVSVDADGWETAGISKDETISGIVQLIKTINSKSKQEDAQTNEALLGSWFVIKRQLSFGLDWEVTTTISRLGQTSIPDSISFPILSNEQIQNPNIKVKDGLATVHFGRGDNIISFNSRLPQSESSITLTANNLIKNNEQWEVACSVVWQCEFSGLSPVGTISEDMRVNQYAPLPGEKVTIDLAKPEALKGITTTVQQAVVRYTLGKRLLDAKLELDILSSEDKKHSIKLPLGYNIIEASVDGALFQVEENDGDILLPIKKGRHKYILSWQQSWEFQFISALPQVNLQMPAVNVSVIASIPRDRWLFWLQGPWGPRVLFFGQLLIVLAISAVLGKYKIGPLGTANWILLGLGLGALSPYYIAIPVFWFLLLMYKQKRDTLSVGMYNVRQFLIALLTFLNLNLLFSSVKAGLISNPEADLIGKLAVDGYPSLGNLAWYQDRIADIFPAPVIVSASIWCWRGFMLLWSLWLTMQLIKWLIWAWNIFSTTLWMKKEPAK